MSQLRTPCSILLFALLALPIARAPGQDSGEATPAPLADVAESIARIESLQKQIEASAELSEAERAQGVELCRSALTELQRAVDFAGQAAQFTSDAVNAQKRYDELTCKYTELEEKELTIAASDGAPPDTLAEFEQALNKQQLQLAKDKNDLALAEAEPKRRLSRRKTVREQLIELPGRIAEIDRQLALPAEEPKVLAEAVRLELEARRKALERESLALESELTKYDAEEAIDMGRLQRDLEVLRLARTEKRVAVIEQQLQEQRTLAAARVVQQAREEAIAATPALKPYAERNQQLAEMSQAITVKHEQVDLALKEAQKALEDLKRLFEQTRSKADIGRTRAVGAMLRKRAASLPDVRHRRMAVAARSDVVDELQYEQLEYEEEFNELEDREALVDSILAEVTPQADENRQLLDSLTKDLLDRKREYLDTLLENYRNIFAALVDLDSTEREIITLTEEYQQYINERVLWIRSSGPLTAAFKIDHFDAWMVEGSLWQGIGRSFWRDARRNAPLYIAVVGLWLLLVLKRRQFQRELDSISEIVARPGFYGFAPTIRAAALTVGIAAALPLPLGFAALRLARMDDADDLAGAVGAGLLAAVAVWIPLELLRQICRRSGLGAAHFGWPESAMKVMRGHLPWLIALGLPLTTITASLAAANRGQGRDAVERAAFMAVMILLAVFLQRALHPSSGLFREYLASHRNEWLDRLREVWHWGGVALPLALAALVFWGYYYTAQVLTWRLYETICLVAAAVVVRALVMRWMMLRRRKLSIEQARQRAAAASQAGEVAAANTAAGIVARQEDASLSDHNAQARSFVSTVFIVATLAGLWWIWVPVLPALGILDQWHLWPRSTTTASPQAQPVVAPRPISLLATTPPAGTGALDQQPNDMVTLADLAFAILASIVTMMCARNVPGLLELAVLQRLPLERSVRYAITSLTSYAIVMVGVVMACSAIGLRWAQVQWLATALTFGLAFGLQEMFANFVAGVILLFERPIRVGDIVTVDDVSGVVSKIRIRATSITNWDRKEYVVPNKEFITGRLLNWTLSDQVNRIVINVGVAHGSDTTLVRELLMKAGKDHPLTLEEPATVATFEGFGDNSLNFVLRTFLPTMENRLQVIHDLHMTIDRLFREAGIEIALPQRDLRIRSAPPAVAAVLGTESNERLDHAHRLGERGPRVTAEQPGARARSA